ncbi:hypothetical protein DB44_BY00230 [Candidatus Protochlamydia amoebophila]|uniref:Uncharacterized protein n=1 Tax=Candidatus Protochlamydia amoebophila TaxID=362787 RepID=A0A0C1JNT5_9BACT|nr:hypothetical protein DB44_BY00230 [Candidatus Protochlamydia amoebophila]
MKKIIEGVIQSAVTEAAMTLYSIKQDNVQHSVRIVGNTNILKHCVNLHLSSVIEDY